MMMGEPQDINLFNEVGNHLSVFILVLVKQL